MKNLPEITELDRIFSGEINFIHGANKPFDFPKTSCPEIVFIGKSNVGKSSLINALTSRKALARVSHTPGRTKQINFFNVRNLFNIVDVPGYGYAKVSDAEHANWEKLILSYLQKRVSHKLILLLIDARRGIKENDQALIQLLEKLNLTYNIIFTKTDKIKKEDIASLETESSKIGARIFFTTTRKTDGCEPLKTALFSFIKKSCKYST